MDERTWCKSMEPKPMFLLVSNQYGKQNVFHLARMSTRKIRLYACACVRSQWGTLRDERYKNAVQAGEFYITNKVSWRQLASAWGAANHANRPDVNGHTKLTVLAATCASALVGPHLPSQLYDISPTQASILRDIVGSPWKRFYFRGETHTAKPDITAYAIEKPWFNKLVRSLAEQSYEERITLACSICDGTGCNPHDTRLPCVFCNGSRIEHSGCLDPANLAVLADAMEDTGFDNQYLLQHLRGYEPCPESYDRDHDVTTCECSDTPGWIKLRSPHYRGCWAVDLVHNRIRH